jgi:hypothetical protein
MTANQHWIEAGVRTWLTEQTLRKVRFEMYSPQSDQAYEYCDVEISYLDDPREEVVKPPIEELEALFTRLEKLPPQAKFRVVVTTAPGASHVDGWAPTTLRELAGGVKEVHEVGTEGHGYGPINGRTSLWVSNWYTQPEKPRPEGER